VGLDERENKSASDAGALVFSLVETHEPGEAGRRIDAGSVTLHPNFMSLMSSW
jgi:hypothetical protein